MSKEDEYKEIFLAEAEESHEELNRLLTVLEKKATDKKSIDAIFRITHTLKGNAAGMGFKAVAELSHIMEDLFGEVREGKLTLDDATFTSLFKAIDKLGDLISAVRTGKRVQYRGIKTKLEVLMKNSQQEEENNDAKDEPEESIKEDKTAKAEEQNSAKKQAQKASSTADKIKEEKAEDSAKANQGKPEGNDESSTNSKSDQIEPVDDEPNTETDSTKITFSDLVQVPVRKLDNLLNLVGELTIERDRIISSHQGLVDTNEYARLNRISSDLQYSVMDVRLVQVGFLFNKFHRVIRDAASIEQKKVRLSLQGTETEIDRNILQIISDSLIHLMRNAVGHGLETPSERVKAGKPEEGVITLNAFTESDGVIIQIIDDGKGIDAQKIRERAISKGLISSSDAQEMSDNDIILMIFEPGFSTMDQVTAISGRGVGMDVVKKALDSIGGDIAVHTEIGKGSTFSLRLPASMAVKSTLLFDLMKDTYAIPLSYTEAVVSLYKSDIHKVGEGLMATYLGNTLSIVFLRDVLLNNENTKYKGEKKLHRSYEQLNPDKKLDIVIVAYNEYRVGLVVDKLLQQKEIVEKPLTKPMDQVRIINGVTITGNGHVCLVLNVAEICKMIFNKNFNAKNTVKL